MKKLLASALTLLSMPAFAATITPIVEAEPVPLMDDPLTVLVVTLLVLGLGIRYLRSRQES